MRARQELVANVIMLADLVLTDGNVLTMNPHQPHAKAIAIKNDRIVKIGTKEEMTLCIGKNTKVISLRGRTVVPGLIDTHAHVADFGRMTRIDLRDLKSAEEMKSRIKEGVHEAPEKKWILGHGWDQTSFKEKRYPNLSDLDEASPKNPIVLYHKSERTCILNSKALELAGITKETKSPLGGIIDKDAGTGEITGILRGNATDLVWKVIPEPSEEDIIQATILACEKIVKAGVTSVHWMVSSLIEIQIVQKLRKENELPLRIYMIIPANLMNDAAGLDLGEDFGDNIAKIGGVQIFVDGSIAARTAALFHPYSDDPSTLGKQLCTQEEMNALAVKICKANLQLVIHANGDRGVDSALTTIEKISNEAALGKNNRHRIEHGSLLNRELIQRIKKLEVVLSVQPPSIISEFSVWSAVDRLGPERARWLFPLKTLMKAGIRVSGGSDCPMEPISPLAGIQAAVARKYFPEERITVNEALHMYTVNAAYASFEEDIKGTIETGKLADLTVISRDPLTVPPSEIEDIEVEMTIVGGRVIYANTSWVKDLQVKTTGNRRFHLQYS
jgi:predicted amidohydrolase YtcJ